LTPPLSDGVVLLRELVPADEDALYAACQDEELREFTQTVPSPYLREHAAEFVAFAREERAAGREFHFAVALADAPEALVGVAGVTKVYRDQGSASCGYWVAREARGRGVATRALELLIGFAEEELGLDRLRLWADARNVASQRVAEKAGFVVASHEPRMVRGALRDTVRFALPPRRLRRRST
jgi:RimJ/RimL family protein N-acetyltransferase